jgi:hypothetical protein
MNYNIDTPEDSHAFIDIISNTLGVLILLTLLSVILSGKISEIKSKIQPSDHLTIDFNMPKRNLFLPNSSYYIAISDQIVHWQVDEIAYFLLKNPDKAVGKIPTGEFVFLDMAGYTEEKTIPTDIDSYKLFFTPNRKTIKNQSVMSKEDINALFASLKIDYIKNNIVPLFFVYPSGINIFAKLHDKIINSDIRMRWRPAAMGNDIAIYRSKEQFQDFYFKR